jgi:hypothetical protein
MNDEPSEMEFNPVTGRNSTTDTDRHGANTTPSDLIRPSEIREAEKDNNDTTDTNTILWLLLAFLVPL